jgi:hypothetical protein
MNEEFEFETLDEQPSLLETEEAEFRGSAPVVRDHRTGFRPGAGVRWQPPVRTRTAWSPAPTPRPLIRPGYTTRQLFRPAYRSWPVVRPGYTQWSYTRPGYTARPPYYWRQPMQWRPGYSNAPWYWQRRNQNPFAPGRGTRDEQIRWVQHFLNRILNQNLPVDGVMSPATRTAVRNFQQRYGLPATGYVGPDTQQALVATTSSDSGMQIDPGGDMSGAAAANQGADAADAADAAGGVMVGATQQNPPGADADARELLEEYGLPLGEFGFESEFEDWETALSPGYSSFPAASENEFNEETPGNPLANETNSNGQERGDPRIIDLTAQADKSRRLSTRHPNKVWALVLHQMACCSRVADPLKRFLKMAPHFAILPDGRILQLHPILSLTGASNGFNPGSVAVEFAGNFPDTRGNWWHGDENGRNQVTPAQIEAGRYLVRYLIRTMGLKEILAHRQSSGTRDNDPGPDIWYQVGQWAIDNLGLSDGGPGFKTGTGKSIPDIWRKWGQVKLQPELEFTY